MLEQGDTGMKQEIVVVGAGGHAKVCIELLRAMGKQVAFCVGSSDSPAACLGVPVLLGDEHLVSLKNEGYGQVFIAIGSNGLRLKLGQAAVDLGYTLVNAISPQAVISPSAQLGQGIAVMAGAVINAEASVGDLAIINTGASVDHDCVIGAGVHIAPQCALAGNVNVGRASFLGVGCKVIPDIIIGDRAIIGAGGVVIYNVDDNATSVGVPARRIK
jgi:UDP-perosamine 4-acetyltransferase